MDCTGLGEDCCLTYRGDRTFSSGLSQQEFRSQEFRSSGVQEFRSSGVQEFRSSGVQEFRSSGWKKRLEVKLLSRGYFSDKLDSAASNSATPELL
jgi:hypothetical protein